MRNIFQQRKKQKKILVSHRFRKKMVPISYFIITLNFCLYTTSPYCKLPNSLTETHCAGADPQGTVDQTIKRYHILDLKLNYKCIPYNKKAQYYHIISV